ncbi:Chondro-6-sulfatase [Salmonella enterica subsp. enterica serovar Typhimurium]|nr:Chondro-6-sulfatase [Salmonella enterica subsp. enterica serovar Typhimurium]
MRSFFFYQKVVRLQQRYANGKTIYNSLQTNGVLINEEWAAFLCAAPVPDWYID